MNEQQHSGSRWEPGAGDGLATRPLQGVVVTAPREDGPGGRRGPWSPAPPPPHRGARRSRLLAAGAALGLLLAGGAGGFTLGHAAAPDAGATTVPTGTSPFDDGTGRPDLGGRGGRTPPDGATLPDGTTLPGTDDGTGTGTDPQTAPQTDAQTDAQAGTTTTT